MFEEIPAGSAPDDRQAAVVNQGDAIAVFRNGDGDIVIRQRYPAGPIDPCIVFPPGQADRLIEAIRREAEEKKRVLPAE